MSSREVIENVQADLFAIQDLAYRDFQAKLMPTVNKETVIGVRTPSLRAYAKKFGKTDNVSAFLEVLPHKYYEENNLHGLLIEQIKGQHRPAGEGCPEAPSGEQFKILRLLAGR